MFNFIQMLMMFQFLSDPTLTFQQKMFKLMLPVFVVILIISTLMYFMSGKENFTDMWYGQSQRDSQLVDKQERSDNLVKISKGYLPGEKPTDGSGLLEGFENTNSHYDPRTYEVQPDYHRTVQQFSVDPNPIDSLETPEFMIPKTYKTTYKYENLTEVSDNNIDAMKLNSIESTFNQIEKNKYYKNLLRSKCRAGNRSSHKNCGCSAPKYGEH